MDVVFIALLIQLVASAASLTQVTTNYGTLTLESRQTYKRETEKNIMGSFQSVDGDGIRFFSTPTYLKVTTMDGQAIVEASSAPAPVTVQNYGSDGQIKFFRLLDEAYAQCNGQTFTLPNANDASIAFFQSAEILPSDSWRTTEQHAVQQSVERLVAHPAIRLLEPAAQAMGENLGVTGRDQPEALPFYMTAMRLSEVRNMRQKIAEVSSYPHRWKRYFQNRVSVQAYPNCNLQTCPPCQSDECIGMCGRRCSCWRWVCGDCCLHNGCLEHDLCCVRNGFFSSRCLFPFGLTCNNYNC